MESRCTTLANLKPNVQNWFVKVVVTEKTPIRCLKWGKQQRLVLVDKENYSMQCIIYEQDVHRLDEVLKLYRTYFVGNGKIREITGSTPIMGKSNYQITLSRSTYIKQVDKHEEFPLDHIYQLTAFVDCPQLADSTDRHINLLYGVIHVFPTRFIQRLNKHVQEFVIVTEECRPTTLTLWEQFVETEGLQLRENIHKMPIVLGMRLSVNNYQGTSIGTLPGSTILFDPPIPQAKHLESWLKVNTEYVDKIISQKLYEKEHQAKDRPLDSQIRKISQILSLTETVKSFWIKSTIQVIKPYQRFYFLGCPSCSKACGAVYGSEFTCFYCNNDFPCPKPILRFEAELYDGTGCLEAFAEQTEAEMLLQMSGEDVIKAEMEENRLSLDEINQKFVDKLFFFHIRTLTSELRGKKYTRHTIVTCLSESEQPAACETSDQRHSLLTTQKRLLSDVSMSESQQSSSTIHRDLPPKHAKQS